MDTTGNVDKHIIVQRLNSQAASIKCHLPKVPESIPYPKDTIFVPIAVSDNNPVSHLDTNPIFTNGNQIINIDNNPCYNLDNDTYI